MMSGPPKPPMRSLPPRPCIRSAADVPRSVSSPSVPVMTAAAATAAAMSPRAASAVTAVSLILMPFPPFLSDKGSQGQLDEQAIRPRLGVGKASVSTRARLRERRLRTLRVVRHAAGRSETTGRAEVAGRPELVPLEHARAAERRQLPVDDVI